MLSVRGAGAEVGLGNAVLGAVAVAAPSAGAAVLDSADCLAAGPASSEPEATSLLLLADAEAST